MGSAVAGVARTRATRRGFMSGGGVCVEGVSSDLVGSGCGGVVKGALCCAIAVLSEQRPELPFAT